MIESQSLVAEATKYISNSPEKPLINASNILEGFSKINLDFNDDEETISYSKVENNNEFIIQKNESQPRKEKGVKIQQKIKGSTFIRTEDEQKSVKSLKQATIEIKSVLTDQPFANEIVKSKREDFIAKENNKRRATDDPNETYFKLFKENKLKHICKICLREVYHKEVDCFYYYCKDCNYKHAQSKLCVNTNAKPVITEGDYRR